MSQLLLFLFHFSEEQEFLDFKKFTQKKEFDLCKIRADEAEKNLVEMTKKSSKAEINLLEMTKRLSEAENNLLEMSKRANDFHQKLERSEKDLIFYKLQAEETANHLKVMELEQTTITNPSESGI